MTPGQPTEDGLLFVARARSFATERYRLLEAGPEALRIGVREDEQFIDVETVTFRARIHRSSGALVSLVDLRVGREIVPNGALDPSWGERTARIDLSMGVIQLLDEHYHAGSAWFLDGVHRETSLAKGATTTVTEQGPVRVVLSTTQQVRSSSIVQRTIFHRAIPRIDYETLIDWHEPAGSDAGFTDVKVAFPALLDGAEAWFETPFGATRRPAAGQEVSALRWADAGGDGFGIAVLNQGKHGYDALGTRLRLTLLHGSSDPDLVADLGRHSTHYSLLPHPGSWRQAGVSRQAAGFNQPLLAHRVERPHPSVEHTPWRPVLEGSPSVLLTAMKPAAGGHGVVLRLHESWGRVGEVALSVPEDARASEVTLVEDPVGPLAIEAGRIRLVLRPWQVRSVLVEAG